MVFFDQQSYSEREVVLQRLRAEVEIAYQHPVEVEYDPDQGQDKKSLEETGNFASFLRSISQDELMNLKISLPEYLKKPSEGWVAVDDLDDYQSLLEIAAKKLVSAGHLSEGVALGEIRRSFEEERAHGEVFHGVPGVKVRYGIRFTLSKPIPEKEVRSLESFCWVSGLLTTHQDKYLEFMRVGQSPTDHMIGDIK